MSVRIPHKKKIRKRTRYRDLSQNRRPGDPHTRASFCDKYTLSESAYFTLKRQGKGPRETQILDRVIITPEAEADWLRDREAETAAKRAARKAASATPYTATAAS